MLLCLPLGLRLLAAIVIFTCILYPPVPPLVSEHVWETPSAHKSVTRDSQCRLHSGPHLAAVQPVQVRVTSQAVFTRHSLHLCRRPPLQPAANLRAPAPNLISLHYTCSNQQSVTPLAAATATSGRSESACNQAALHTDAQLFHAAVNFTCGQAPLRPAAAAVIGVLCCSEASLVAAGRLVVLPLPKERGQHRECNNQPNQDADACQHDQDQLALAPGEPAGAATKAFSAPG